VLPTRNFSADQNAKIARNERPNNPAVIRNACAAFVIAHSSPLLIEASFVLKNVTVLSKTLTDIAIDQFGATAVRDAITAEA
jgi:hypothetical protein